MKKDEMMKDRPFYVGMVATLNSIRPLCHIASAITSIMFIVVWIMGQDWAEPFLRFTGIWSYLIVGAVGTAAVAYLEARISKLVDIMGHVIATGHSRRVTIGVIIIAAPFIALTASTSFVGSSEAAMESADAFHQSKSKEIAGSLKQTDFQTHTNREKGYLQQRELQRVNITEKHDAKLKTLIVKNTARFDKAKTEPWHKKKLSEKNQADSSRIKTEEIVALEIFDKETAKGLKEIEERHSKIESAAAAATSGLIKLGTDNVVQKVDRLKWIGWFFGLITMIAVFVSIGAAILVHYVSEVCKIKKEEIAAVKK